MKNTLWVVFVTFLITLWCPPTSAAVTFDLVHKTSTIYTLPVEDAQFTPKRYVAMSADGQTIVGPAANGSVLVYRWTDYIPSLISGAIDLPFLPIPQGTKFKTEYESVANFTGEDMAFSLSHDGTVLFAGSGKLNKAWMLERTSPYDTEWTISVLTAPVGVLNFGEIGAVSGDGDLVAIAGGFSYYIFSRVMNCTKTWTLQGSINPPTYGASQFSDYAGNNLRINADVSMSYDGMVIAASWREHQVSLFQYDGETGWTLKSAFGIPDPVGSEDRFGWSIGLTHDASQLVVGAPYWWGPEFATGCTYVFTNPLNNTEMTWNKLITFDHLDNNNVNNEGWSVSVSPNGEHVVVGAPMINSAAVGGFRYYHFNQTTEEWDSAFMFANPATGDFLTGIVASINADGSKIVVVGTHKTYFFARD